MKTLFNSCDWSKPEIKSVFGIRSGKAGTKITDAANTQIYQLSIKLNGLTEIFYNGEKINFCGGSVLYLPKEKSTDIDYHKTIIEQSNGICIFFDSCNPLPDKPILIKYTDQETEKLFLKINSIFNAPDCNFFESMSEFYRLLAVLDKALAEETGAKNKRINAAAIYMQKHLCAPFADMKTMAETCGMNVDSFRHEFKKIYGISPLQYYNQLKMNYIKSLICRNEYSMTYIANAAGFSDLNYFSRFFKKHMGVSPTSYKKSFEKSAVV